LKDNITVLLYNLDDSSVKKKKYLFKKEKIMLNRRAKEKIMMYV